MAEFKRVQMTLPLEAVHRGRALRVIESAGWEPFQVESLPRLRGPQRDQLVVNVWLRRKQENSWPIFEVREDSDEIPPDALRQIRDVANEALTDPVWSSDPFARQRIYEDALIEIRKTVDVARSQEVAMATATEPYGGLPG